MHNDMLAYHGFTGGSYNPRLTMRGNGIFGDIGQALDMFTGGKKHKTAKKTQKKRDYIDIPLSEARKRGLLAKGYVDIPLNSRVGGGIFSTIGSLIDGII